MGGYGSYGGYGGYGMPPPRRPRRRLRMPDWLDDVGDWFDNYRSEPLASPGARIAARLIDAAILAFILFWCWMSIVGNLRTQAYRLPREIFAEAFAGGVTEGADGIQAGATGAVTDAVDETRTLIAIVLVLHIIVPVVYELACQMLLGRTPGKMICGLRVVPASGIRDRAGIVGGLVRSVLFMGLPLVLLFFAVRESALNNDGPALAYGIGFLAACLPLWLMALPARRGLHDVLSGTVVISTQRMSRMARRLTG